MLTAAVDPARLDPIIHRFLWDDDLGAASPDMQVPGEFDLVLEVGQLPSGFYNYSAALISPENGRVEAWGAALVDVQ